MFLSPTPKGLPLVIVQEFGNFSESRYLKTAISNSWKFPNLFLDGWGWDLQYGCFVGLGQQSFPFSQLMSQQGSGGEQT